ncbi:hypothetical protein BDV96DRAFT_694353 [Lophiotrema nucula]|uniref:CCHC-type domain-containing protein n=1 Tax=Lophiotrema nucula TaxID=690887 RepID=A0A6A5YFN0_9PLEO|nr:hypothetical protein BDV96DRAFT_694353 [Lophiotrema nucula]
MSPNGETTVPDTSAKTAAQPRQSGRGRQVGGRKGNRRFAKPTNAAAEKTTPKESDTRKDSVLDPSPSADKKDSVSSKDAITKQKKDILTPAQAARLKSGAKANIYVGPLGDQYIGIEGAFVNLLAQYSGLAKQNLVGEGSSRLAIPDGSKNIVTWIYKYMLAGERDPEGDKKFDDLSMLDLSKLYGHAAVLEYTDLMEKTRNRLEHLLRIVIPDIHSVRNILAFIPDLNSAVVAAVGRLYLLPWAMDYAPYTKYCEEHTLFGAKVEQYIETQRLKRIGAGERYYSSTHPNYGLARSNKLFQELSTGSSSKDQQSSDAKKTRRPKRSKGNACFKCSEEGHLARHCTAAATNDGVSQDPVIVSATKMNAAPATTRSPPTCYNCKEVGHIARYCTQPRAYQAEGIEFVGAESSGTDHASPVSSTRPTGRNKFQKRARADRRPYQPYNWNIDVQPNGEGLTTCDVEVRSGQVTRTGMVI